MLSENAAHGVAEYALAGATLAAQDKGDLGAFVGMLHRPRQPIDDVNNDFLITACNHLPDVVSHQRPVTMLRLDTPSAPQIEPIVDYIGTPRLERNSLILPSFPVLQPPISQLEGFIPNADELVHMQISEILETKKRWNET